MKNWIKEHKITTLIIGGLILLVSGQQLEIKNLEWELIYEKSVPDVELINYLSFDSKNIAAGSVTGFVVFDDKEKQPRDLRQYVTITASENFDISGKQIFYLTDIVKMNVLAPRYFEPVALTFKNMADEVITLADNSNNFYQINLNTKEVSMFDATKDVTKLITNQSDFRDFMVQFLR